MQQAFSLKDNQEQKSVTFVVLMHFEWFFPWALNLHLFSVKEKQAAQYELIGFSDQWSLIHFFTEIGQLWSVADRSAWREMFIFKQFLEAGIEAALAGAPWGSGSGSDEQVNGFLSSDWGVVLIGLLLPHPEVLVVLHHSSVWWQQRLVNKIKTIND